MGNDFPAFFLMLSFALSFLTKGMLKKQCIMNNSNFNIEEKLNLIENQISRLNISSKEILSFDEATIFLSYKASYLYKISCPKNPVIRSFQPSGKLKYFLKSDLEEHLLRNAIEPKLEEDSTPQSHWKK